MKKAPLLGLLFLLTLIVGPVNGQIIPQEWEGNWHGIVHIWSYNVETDSFPMSLELAPKDAGWDFIITYDRNPDVPDIRTYELIIVDSVKHHLAIDEKNSILLDSYFNDSCLYTRFGGLGSDLLTQICMNDGSLSYKIVSNFSEPNRVSGNEVIGSDTIPEIRSYDLYHIMKAQLTKVSEE